jgi:hypothetical protein
MVLQTRICWAALSAVFFATADAPRIMDTTAVLASHVGQRADIGPLVVGPPMQTGANTSIATLL